MRSSTFSFLLAAPLALAATIDVSVGPNGNFVYQPESVIAQAGDTINFTFNPKNHTVTQSSFDTPCSGLDGGFKTGFIPVGTGSTDSRQFTVPASTGPLWFYCGQVGHCAAGMVFAINAPAEGDPKSFSAFKARAQSSGGVASGASSPPATITTPPAPHWVSATATVTWQSSTYTTTYTSYDGTPPPTPAAQPMDHKITVGDNGKFVYSPANISASIGDTVTFEFKPKNHTVTQSSFLTPCTKLKDASGNPGFASGFKPVGASDTTFPTFQIKINDTAPIWGYCGQPGHCQAGMVFSINAVESGPNNFAAFQQLAINSGSTNTTSTGSGSPGSPSGSPSGNSALTARIGYGFTTLFILAASCALIF
ncbi:Cupredoxin [Crepidotus variabilis]|uniref:Cupredoxin n=1 Tax=Crepidotus variabilis TaxID=179855 RepID=A0A9P6E930_9AGAR|nr:Cupredoxin [Crepidotus variabilis]